MEKPHSPQQPAKNQSPHEFDNERRALQMAAELAEPATLREIFFRIIFEDLSPDDWSEFCAIFDANFKSYGTRGDEIRAILEKALPDDLKPIVQELFENVQMSAVIAQEIGAFYVGVAWGRRLAAFEAAGNSVTPAPSVSTFDEERRKRAGAAFAKIYDIAVDALCEVMKDRPKRPS